MGAAWLLGADGTDAVAVATSAFPTRSRRRRSCRAAGGRLQLEMEQVSVLSDESTLDLGIIQQDTDASTSCGDAGESEADSDAIEEGVRAGGGVAPAAAAAAAAAAPSRGRGATSRAFLGALRAARPRL